MTSTTPLPSRQDVDGSSPSTLSSDCAQSSPKSSTPDLLPPPPIPVPEIVETAEDEKLDIKNEDKTDHSLDVYDRFTPRKKKQITAIVSYCAFISPVTASVFLPSIPQIADDLKTTPATINYTVAVFIVVIGVAPLLWSPLSGFYGRRPIYMASMPIMLVASIGVAFSQNVGQIICTRVLQGIGSSSVLAVGAGSIGDIYKPSERATAMGWFYSGALLGPALSPLIAGLFTEYTAHTWRSTQFFLVGCAALAVFLVVFLLPETHHPPLPHQILCEERQKKFVPYIFNPLSILGLFRWPNICAITFVSSCIMLQIYCLLVPLSTLFQERYAIHNVAIAGLLYLSSGGGNVIGSRIAGPWADRNVARYKKKRGYRRPEDRLRASLLGIGILLPLSCLAYGWLVEYNAGGIAPPMVFLVINGCAVMMVFTPLNTYAVDCMQKRSAEVIAVNNFIRYLFSAAASAFVIPLADSIGWGWTMTFASAVVWLSCGVMLLTIRYGHIWRERANERYGYVVDSADEQHGKESTLSKESSKSKDAEAGISSGSSESDIDHHGEHHDSPGSLVALNPKVQQENRGGIGGNNKPSLTRTPSARSDMPAVEEVLKRTVSLSGASVHGGG